MAKKAVKDYVVGERYEHPLERELNVKLKTHINVEMTIVDNNTPFLYVSGPTEDLKRVGEYCKKNYGAKRLTNKKDKQGMVYMVLQFPRGTVLREV